MSNIDGLRGVAAMLVVVQHSFESLKIESSQIRMIYQSVFSEINNFGRIGVVAFFAVSGFVIPFSFRNPRPNTTFIISRLFRLYPAYWLSLAAVYYGASMISDNLITDSQMLFNLSMLQAAFRVPNALPVYWTLYVEIIFYIICIIMFNIGVLTRPLVIFWLILVSITVDVLASVIALYGGRHIGGIGYVFFICIMMFGTVVRLAVVDGDRVARKLMPCLLVIILAVNPIVTLASYVGVVRVESPIAGVLGLAFGILLFISTVRYNLFSGKTWTFLGSISYSMYLMHSICFGVSRSLFGNTVLCGIVTIASSVLISSLTYYFVERPAVEYGRRITKMIRSRNGGAGNATYS